MDFTELFLRLPRKFAELMNDYMNVASQPTMSDIAAMPLLDRYAAIKRMAERKMKLNSTQYEHGT